MKMIDFLRVSNFLVSNSFARDFKGSKDDFETYLKQRLVNLLLPELEKVIEIKEINDFNPYDTRFEASVVIIPTEKAVEISKKLKRLEELERQYVADND